MSQIKFNVWSWLAGSSGGGGKDGLAYENRLGLAHGQRQLERRWLERVCLLDHEPQQVECRQPHLLPKLRGFSLVSTYEAGEFCLISRSLLCASRPACAQPHPVSRKYQRIYPMGSICFPKQFA